MYQRLVSAIIIGVFAAVMASSSFSAPNDLPGGSPRNSQLIKISGGVSPYEIPPVGYRALGRLLDTLATDVTPTPAPPEIQETDTVSCYTQDYYNPPIGPYYKIDFFNAQGPTPNRALACRFDVKNSPGYVAVIDKVTAIIRFASHLGGAGTPVRIQVLTDAGNLPGSLLATYTFVVPSRIDSPTWMTFTLPSPLEVGSSAYHVSIGSDPSMVPGDSLSVRLAQGPATTRTSWYEAATWWTMMAAVGGNYPLALYIHECEHYTSCYTQVPLTGNVSLSAIPNESGWSNNETLDGIGQRFTTSGPETLSTVTVVHYDYSRDYGAGAFYPLTGTNGIIVELWQDNGSGGINNGSGPLATATIPGGLSSLFPATGGDGSANGWNFITASFSPRPVLAGAFHITVRMTSDNTAAGQLLLPLNDVTLGNWGTGASVNFSPPSGANWRRTGASPEWLAAGLGERAFYILPHLCRDEFYLCQQQQSYDDFTSGFGIGTAQQGFAGWGLGQIFRGYDINRVDTIAALIGDDRLVGGAAGTNGNPRVVFEVRAAVSGRPGTAVLWSSGPLVPKYWDDIHDLMRVEIPGGAQIAGNFVVDVMCVSADSGDYVYVGGDRGGIPQHTVPAHTNINGGAWLYSNQGSGWVNRPANLGTDVNGLFEAKFCSVVPIPTFCAPDDYLTAGHDFGHSGVVNVDLGDANCDLSLKWMYADPNKLTAAGRIGSAGPITFDTLAVCGFGSSYRIFSLNSGLLLKTITGSGSPDYIASSGLNCTPTIARIVVGGVQTNVLFVGGGTTNSVSAYNMDVAGFPQIWSINSGNYSSVHHLPSEPGNTSNSNFVISNNGTSSRLMFGTGSSQLWAVNGATGDNYWGPVVLDGPVSRAMASDGTNLLVTTIATPPGNPEGDVWSISAGTGTILWKLSTAIAGGLKGNGSVFPAGTYPNESFPSGCTVHDNMLYVVSSPAGLGKTYPADGVYYEIVAATGQVVRAHASQHPSNSAGAVSEGTPIVTDQQVILPGASAWANPPLGGNILAHSGLTGNLQWIANVAGMPANGVYGDGFVSCSGSGSGLLFVGSTYGFLSCLKASSGEELFHRRIDINPPNNTGLDNRMAGLAVSKRGEVLVTARQGYLFCLSRQTIRPRLEIVNYAPSAATLGQLPSVSLDFGKTFTNTGCEILTGNLRITDGSNGSAPPGAASADAGSVSAPAASIAEQLTAESAKGFRKAWPLRLGTEPGTEFSARNVNRATAALPPFINGAGVIPFSVNPGDTGKIVLDIKQNLITRGMHQFYCSFESNDPDFFLNNPSERPEVILTINGGGLIDTSSLHFGASGTNLQLVTNTGRLGTGEWNPHGFKVDGYSTDYYQGTYIYGVSQHRIALNSQDWVLGGGESEAWVSLQADLNTCTHDYKPGLVTGVSLGSISSTGVTYVPLYGNLVCRKYFDSVQTFGSTSEDWYWPGFPSAQFNPDSTMGLMVSSRVIGFVDAPAPFTSLNNVTVDLMRIWQRYNQPLSGWKLGVTSDYDLGKDTAVIDRSISAGWSVPTASSRPRGAWGVIKLPFGGCSASIANPIKNVKALDIAQSVEDLGILPVIRAHGNAWLDSAYTWMSQPSGATSQGNVSTAVDQDFFATLAEHNFVAGDTFALTVAQFGLPTITNPSNSANIAPLAHLLNKWLGFERGDVNGDGTINIADIVYLARYVNGSTGVPGPVPFVHIGDVNCDGAVNAADVTYLVGYYLGYGPCPKGALLQY